MCSAKKRSVGIGKLLATPTSGIDFVRCGIALPVLLSTAFFSRFLAVHDVPLVAFEPGLNLYQLVTLVAVLPMNVH